MTEENSKKIITIVCVAVAAILLFLTGFFVGRKTIDETVKVETKYVKLPPVTDTITNIVPSAEIFDIDTADIIKDCISKGVFLELFPEKNVYINDSVFIPMTSEDTLKMVVDWATKRYYSEILFDIDTLGKCSLTAVVQYNRLDSIKYIFEPIQKETTITKYKTKLFSPYIGAGWLTYPGKVKDGQFINAQVGTFIKEKYGIEIMYQRDYINNKDIVGGSFIYKF